MDQATDRANDLRLNWFVSPRLEFQRAAATNRFSVGSFIKWETKDVPGKRRHQLLTALRRWVRHEARHLLISDDPGQGKTVLSLRVEHLLCREKTREQIFGDKLPRLVVHWMSQLPATKFREPTLRDLLMVDPSLIQWLRKLNERNPEPVDPRKIIDYALENDRLIIILDAYDELPEAQKLVFGKLFRNTCNQVRWIITGRDWAINREIAYNIFHPNEFFRLRIKAFDSGLQDRYMERALPGIDWRATLEGSKEEWDELLGLPATLRALVDALSMSGAEPQASLRFSSPSDLFCYCSSVMLFRELKKEKNVQSLRELDEAPAKAVGHVQKALGAVALEMALRGHWREVIKETTRDLDDEIDAIWDAAKTRFLGGAPPGQEAENANIWKWVKKFLNDYQFHGGAPQADLNAQSMVFRNQRIHELNIARYLSDFASDEDLRGGPDSEKTGKVKQDQHATNVLHYLGDEKWANTWRCAIRMPIRDEGKPHGVTAKRYKQAMLLLFERPANPALRRPTELMWIADQYFKSNRLKALRREIRHYLGQQFLACVQDKRTRATALGLIDISNYVILADPANPSDAEKAVEAAIVQDGGSFQIGQFKRSPQKKPWLHGTPTPESGTVTVPVFGVAKCIMSNCQFQLWDDNCAGLSDLDREWYGGEQQVAVRASWLDAYWYASFVDYGRRAYNAKAIQSGEATMMLNWRVCLPTENLFEYAYRAGSEATFFYAWRKKGGKRRLVDVIVDDLWKYAHFDARLEIDHKTVPVNSKQPNAFGCRLAGNSWKWMHDSYHIGWRHVIRGGSWSHEASYCDASYREAYPATSRWENTSFVLALMPLEICVTTQHADKVVPVAEDI